MIGNVMIGNVLVENAMVGNAMNGDLDIPVVGRSQSAAVEFAVLERCRFLCRENNR
ncbi:MAG: hypothetical protein ACTSYI_08150 [Promethearchaeota archaeon]